MSSTQEVGEIFGAGKGPAHAMMRSPTVLIASIGLWGMNVFFFRIFGIDYVKVLKHDLWLIDGNGGTPTILSSSAIPTQGFAHRPHQLPPSSQEELLVRQRRLGDDAYSSDESQSDEVADDDSAVEVTLIVDGNAVTWGRLVGLSLCLLILLHSTYYCWIDMWGGGSIGAVFAFYATVTIAIVFPLPSTRWLRKATVLVLQRAFELVNPRCSCVSLEQNTCPRPIPFVDVFFADAMCSLSKVLFDWGMLMHMASHYPYPVPKDIHHIVIPSVFAAIPFLIRARQCLVMYTVGRLRNDAHRAAHLWNALKYSTSVFPLCLSAYQKTVSAKRALELEPYLIGLVIINSTYALYWDIVMDWGFFKNPGAACVGGIYPMDQNRPKSCGHAILRPRLRFGVAMSVLILTADTILRFSWLLRFYHTIFPSGDSFAMCTQFLEVFRRAMWNLLRIEWENLKQSTTPQPNSKTKDEEMVKFLPKSGTIPRKIETSEVKDA
ncbi:predicted protein [Phaeodactylum tricornutum CCAP 1055/1]|jgi:hypothetical protein|uniref:EXS domain-containing protein n=2 Tax=Phaeodactylum tricornutum TaxID=2850 RepID=B7FZI5_PHATC|nr:predicted protein [Phaeodactylum tricornutum CCAP 1055/1]EEC48547.1 predicted protein [Phaeodactylum tricornutum CCAP 1055/1]|eukprot:XP_002180356.1 predicted protein [Phaeodactylum tricornutum CCAP 1055/1]